MTTGKNTSSLHRTGLATMACVPLLFLFLSGDVHEAIAACKEGSTSPCIVGGRKGTAECIGGRMLCEPDNPPPTTPPGVVVPPGPGKFDLLAPSEDDNGLPLNPRWRFQEQYPNLLPLLTFDAPQRCGSEAWKSPCTAYPTTDDNWSSAKSSVLGPLSSAFGVTGCLSGHHNWMPVTYTGQLYWESHSEPGTDDDYNFRLVPPPAGNTGMFIVGAGVTGESYTIFPTTGEIRKSDGSDEISPIDGTRLPITAGAYSLGVEFDSDETIDHFTTPWWVSFHDAVDAVSKAKGAITNCVVLGGTGCTQSALVALFEVLRQKQWAVYNMVAGKHTIVSGLYGLDCAHGCFPEIHPVFAMAIRVKDDPTDEVWEIFARRSGDEGFCSEKEYAIGGLPNDAYALRLPTRGTGVQVTREQWGTKSGSISVSYPPIEARHGKIVAFNTASLDDVIHGELHLAWTGPVIHPLPGGIVTPPLTRGAAPRPPIPTGPPPSIGPGVAPASPTPSNEEGLEQIVSRMTDPQRQIFLGKMPAKAAFKHTTPPRALTSSLVKPVRPPPVPLRPSVKVSSNPGQQAKDQQLIDALRAVFGPNLDQNLPPRRAPRPPHCHTNPRTGVVVCTDGGP